jgi:thiamine biosynthesis lipoprotein
MKESTFNAMGTLIQLKVNEETPDEVLDMARRMVLDFERRFSANADDSVLADIKRNAGLQPVKVDQDIFQLIKVGKHYSLQTGFLNIAIGPLVQLWRIGFDDARKPSDSEIQQALTLTNPEQIVLNEEKRTVFLTQKGMSIDLGGLAKGFFADILLQYFKQNGVQSSLINLGGNIVVMGDGPKATDGRWEVGIQNPSLHRGEPIAVLKVRNKSVVTSGIYERTANFEGKTYHHIFDPKTGYPIEPDMLSLTIVSDSSLMGEVLTTQLFGYTPKIAVATADKIGAQALSINTEKNIIASKLLKNIFVC